MRAACCRCCCAGSCRCCRVWLPGVSTRRRPTLTCCPRSLPHRSRWGATSGTLQRASLRGASRSVCALRSGVKGASLVTAAACIYLSTGGSQDCAPCCCLLLRPCPPASCLQDLPFDHFKHTVPESRVGLDAFKHVAGLVRGWGEERGARGCACAGLACAGRGHVRPSLSFRSHPKLSPSQPSCVLPVKRRSAPASSSSTATARRTR